MGVWVPPTPSEFKAFFNRDFNYAPPTDLNNLDFVCDSDIQKAINEGVINFSAGMFDGGSQSTTVFMYLAAFYLVDNIQRSSRGLSAQSTFVMENSSVQGVSAGYVIPDRYKNNPVIAQYAKNDYGNAYLSYVLPQLVGNVRIAGSGYGYWGPGNYCGINPNVTSP